METTLVSRLFLLGCWGQETAITALAPRKHASSNPSDLKSVPSCIVNYRINFVLKPFSSKCCVWTSGISIPGELTGNGNIPGLTADLLTRTCVLTSSPSDSFPESLGNSSLSCKVDISVLYSQLEFEVTVST